MGMGCSGSIGRDGPREGEKSAQEQRTFFSFCFLLFIHISCFQICNFKLEFELWFPIKYAQSKFHNGCIERYHFIIILLFHSFK
jgi:hypothetical protein